MINTYKLKFTILQQEILRLLFAKAGMSLNQHMIARLLDVSQPAVQKALPRLVETEYLRIAQDKESKRWAIELNREHHQVIQLKRADNLRKIYATGLADLLEVKFAGGTIILFGSYSRGDDTVESDIDIAIIGRKQKNVNLEQYEKILERKININFYDSFNEIHKHLRENLCNGIVLSGGVEL